MNSKARFGFMDVAFEAVEAVRGRRVRSVLTILGVAFGILTLVSTVALTGTAAAQVSARFDALKATSIAIGGFASGAESHTGDDGLRPRLVSPDAQERASDLNGVVALGVASATKDELPPVTRTLRSASNGEETPVLSLNTGAMEALRVSATAGRLFDSGHEERHDRVAVIGDIAARNLGIDRVDGNTLIFIADRPYLLLGIATTPYFDSQAPLAVLVPEWVSRDPSSGVSFTDPQVVIRTQPGAAQQIAREAKIALDPAAPERLIAQVPPDPNQLRAAVETDTQTLFLVMAAVSLVIGAIGIGNTTLVAVLERRHEIGLRRAIGASRWSILAQFLLESSLLGLLGGVFGTVAGLDMSIGIALYKGWTASISPWLSLIGPALGLSVGLLAGVYPAAKASRMEPITALTT